MNGTDETWKNESTMWLLYNMHDAEQRFEYRVNSIDINDQLQKRIMDQALRELLLMQASDWHFSLQRIKLRIMQKRDSCSIMNVLQH